MDCYGNPLGAVRVLFDKACGTAASPAEFARSDWGIRELFQSHLYGENCVSQVPEINSVPLDAIPVNSLVRFRGMVQDMFDVEYYIGAYKDRGAWHTTKYMDVADVPSGSDAEPQMWDRRLLYCVPIPGENLWVKEAHSLGDSRGSPTLARTTVGEQAEKRPRETENEPEDMDADDSSAVTTSDSKRMRGDGEASASNSLQGAALAVPDLDLNMPLQSVGGSKLFPCLVKVYDGQDEDLKLNDLVEFFGVLTFDPELSTASFSHGGDDSDMDVLGSAFLEDHVSMRLPASKVPRLQCITLRKLANSHPSPQRLEVDLAGSPSVVEQTRQSLLESLKMSLGGDSLAAEYLLLHLLSQVHARVDSMALGKLSLNLTGCDPGLQGAPSPLAVTAANTIAKLVPRSHLMPLFLQTLNLALIAPRKDYGSNRLVTGTLQLAEGTHLTLDETVLQAGTLSPVGVQNLESLKHLLQWQKVEYDFQFYKMEMPADVPVLVLSQAKSSMLPTDVVVPLMSTTSPAPLIVNDETLASWRLYLTAARDMNHALEPSMQQSVEDDLVAAKQEDRTLGPATFHRWLTLARLMSISYLEPTLSPERWRMVRDLEHRCAVRLRCC